MAPKGNYEHLLTMAHLICFLLKEESSTVTHICRIRALQALFTLVSLEVVEATSGMGKSLDEIRYVCLIYSLFHAYMYWVLKNMRLTDKMPLGAMKLPIHCL